MNFFKQKICRFNKNMNFDKKTCKFNPLMEKLVGKLKKEGIVTKNEVYDALLQTDRGDFADNEKYAYIDR